MFTLLQLWQGSLLHWPSGHTSHSLCRQILGARIKIINFTDQNLYFCIYVYVWLGVIFTSKAYECWSLFYNTHFGSVCAFMTYKHWQCWWGVCFLKIIFITDIHWTSGSFFPMKQCCCWIVHGVIQLIVKSNIHAFVSLPAFSVIWDCSVRS